MYYSVLLGDPTNRPTIKGSASFSGMALIDADPYLDSGANWYTNQNNFFRSVRNFIIDTTAQPAETGTGIHWQVAQATSLINIHFEMSTADGNKHQGIFMDNGSGGFMSDLSFNGGATGAFFGNQQFMTRNLTFTNCGTAIVMNWAWQWTLKSVNIDNCKVGVDMSALGNNGAQDVGSVVLMDSTISNTATGVLTYRNASSMPTSGGSLVLDNVVLDTVTNAVASPDGTSILSGGSSTIDLWGQGRTYTTSGDAKVVQGAMTRAFAKPPTLLDGAKVFERSRPQYTDVAASNIISVRSQGAKGDGSTDDTTALKTVFSTYGGKGNDNVIFFDHGVYVVSNTIEVPVNTRIIGEAWSVIMADGTAFQDVTSPTAVFQVGKSGDTGMVEMSELIFQTKGPQPGAVLLEWNSADPSGSQGVNGMWDTHFRVGGSAGTELQTTQCPTDNTTTVTPDPKCMAGFLSLHIGKTASLYMENVWAWTADHNLDADPTNDQITIYNGRGVYDESANGPVWMYAAASEHNVLYQFEFANAKNVFIGMAQTETPYFQSNPAANVPFKANSDFNDPDFSTCTEGAGCKAWAFRTVKSSDMLVYGAGFYSFFDNYGQTCLADNTCQTSVVDIDSGSSDISVYNLNTVGTTNLITLNNNNMVAAAENNNTFADTIMNFNV
jgi:glucan 1,3-beta-glucosidase